MWTGSVPGRDRRRKCRSATSPTASTCRPGWRRRCGSSTTATWARTGSERSGEPERLGDDRRRRRRRAVGDAPGAQGAADRLRPAARGPRRPSGAASRRRSSTQLPTRPEPRRADDRLRPAVRHLQAGQPDPPGPRAHRRAGQRPAAARSSSSSPARPTRTDDPGKELLQQIAELAPRPAVRRQGRVRRGLRHQRRPAPGAGRRRLAQQPAAAAGGLGHQRAEGRAQRRPEPLDPRRLVGRGLRRHATASPSARARRTAPRDIQDQRDARRALRGAAATRSIPLYYRPRPRRPAARPGSPA